VSAMEALSVTAGLCLAFWAALIVAITVLL
jgi:hypothetical protein